VLKVCILALKSYGKEKTTGVRFSTHGRNARVIKLKAMASPRRTREGGVERSGGKGRKQHFGASLRIVNFYQEKVYDSSAVSRSTSKPQGSREGFFSAIKRTGIMPEEK